MLKTSSPRWHYWKVVASLGDVAYRSSLDPWGHALERDWGILSLPVSLYFLALNMRDFLLQSASIFTWYHRREPKMKPLDHGQ
jgi:hypothetical protein